VNATIFIPVNVTDRFFSTPLPLMAPRSPSIQSFFEVAKPPACAPLQTPTSLVATPGDGFTTKEIDAVLYPKIDNSWMPSRNYEEIDIAELIPGPRSVMFHGRIANLYDHPTTSKKPKAAKGCVKLIVKDDSGAVTVSTERSTFFRKAATFITNERLNSRLDCGMQT
jgi:hypothetical protein